MSKFEFKCIDAHTCGNPVRVVTTGHPPLEGLNMSEKRQHFLNEFDWIRKGLMYEPRGHDLMSGSFLYPPQDPSNDVAILFIETSGCLPMCGHGTIGSITVALEAGLITPKIPGKVKMEAPAGLLDIEYSQVGTKVEWVKIINVKSYLAKEALRIEDPNLGTLTFDVAYGGNFYAIVDPQENFSGVQDFTASELIRISQKLRLQINLNFPNQFIHPEDSTINGVSHILWTGTPLNPNSSGRNAVFYGDKAIDRSPCGTGTSARIAQLYAKGQLKLGQKYIHESYIGSTFTGCIEAISSVGAHTAIVPSIQGWARIYGHNTISIDLDDPYAHGFQVL